MKRTIKNQLSSISIVIPVYNEEKTVKQLISRVLKADTLGLKKEIIIVDDGSSDKTQEILKNIRNSKVKVFAHPRNFGKGMALRSGFKHAAGDIILVQDADLEYSVDEIAKIIKPLVNGRAEIVYGSRFKGKIANMRWQNWLANKILTFTANLLYGLNITDEATAYKAFNRNVLQNINLKCIRFEFCPEVTAKVAKKGHTIYEVPIQYRARNIKEGKKIKPSDAFQAIWTLIYYRFKN